MDDADKLKRRLDKAVDRAMERIARRTITRLRYWSSGSFSLEQLRDLFDYAYATRHGRPKHDPFILNEQTGDVKESWDYTIDGFNISVHNDSDIYNRFLYDGTWKMFARGGIEDRVKVEIMEIADSIIEDEIMKELNRG